MNRLRKATAIVIALALGVGIQATVPQLINYQGRLSTSQYCSSALDGAILPNLPNRLWDFREHNVSHRFAE